MVLDEGTKGKIFLVAREFYQVLGSGLLFFLALELLKPRAVLAYINISWWFVFWLISAIIILIYKPYDPRSHRQKIE